MVDVDTPKPRLHYVSEGYLHYSEGTAGDGNIYVDDDGYNVKLDKEGETAGAGGSIESEENEYEGYVPDFEFAEFP